MVIELSIGGDKQVFASSYHVQCYKWRERTIKRHVGRHW